MDQLRTTKVARLLQKELGDMFLHEAKKLKGVMVSVSEVRLSPDLSIARVYLSIFPDAQADAQIKSVQESASTIRYDLAKRVRSQLRRMPELIFHLDKSALYAEHIDDLLGLTKKSAEDLDPTK